MTKSKTPEPKQVQSAKPCKYCGKPYQYFKVLGNPGYCEKPKCTLLAMRAGV